MKDEILDAFKERIKSPTWMFLIIAYFVLKFEFLALFLKGPLKDNTKNYFEDLSKAHHGDWWFLIDLILLALCLFIIFKFTDIVFKFFTIVANRINEALENLKTISILKHDEEMQKQKKAAVSDLYTVLQKVQLTSNTLTTKFTILKPLNNQVLSTGVFAEVIRNSNSIYLKHISGKSKYELEAYSYVLEKLSDNYYLCAEVQGSTLIPYRWDSEFGVKSKNVYIYDDNTMKVDPEIPEKYVLKLEKFDENFVVCSTYPKPF